MLSRCWWCCAVVALMPLLVACEPAAEPGADAGQEPERGALSSAPAPLMPIDHSGVTGAVVLDEEDDGATVTLSLEGLEPGAGYLADLHHERCASAGSLLAPLGSLAADDAGEAMERVHVRAADLDAARPWSVHIRTAAGESVACANILTD
jgi:hypothetical protein